MSGDGRGGLCILSSGASSDSCQRLPVRPMHHRGDLDDRRSPRRRTETKPHRRVNIAQIAQVSFLPPTVDRAHTVTIGCRIELAPASRGPASPDTAQQPTRHHAPTTSGRRHGARLTQMSYDVGPDCLLKSLLGLSHLEDTAAQIKPCQIADEAVPHGLPFSEALALTVRACGSQARVQPLHRRSAGSPRSVRVCPHTTMS